MGLIPGLGRSLGEGNGNPLQYSCLENPMDGRAWWATVHGVAELDMTEDVHRHLMVQNAQSVSSVTQSCPTLCDPMDCSMPDVPVHHQLLELTQTHVHWKAVMPSNRLILYCPLLLQFPPESGSFPMSHFFASGGQRIGASASVLPTNI